MLRSSNFILSANPVSFLSAILSIMGCANPLKGAKEKGGLEIFFKTKNNTSGRLSTLKGYYTLIFRKNRIDFIPPSS